jgi:beta-lactamase regulating signal transducer with metallopeptidase domain/protocatechuate 3,4-dioxygenase beta subunit
MYGLLALPVLALLLPAWHVGFLQAVSSPEGQIENLPHANADPDALDVLLGQQIPPRELREEARKPDALAKTQPAETSSPQPTQPAPPEDATASSSARLSLPTWLCLIWVAGTMVTLMPLLAGLVGLVWLARKGQRVTDPAWTSLARNLGEQLGLKRPVTLLRCAGGTMPMTWGLVRPVVLLPEDADDWPIDRRRLVLLHELSHVQRRDCLTQLLAQIACALYWFHPLVWLAARQLRLERERACDDQVLLTGSRASDYAYLLLETARSLRSPRCPGLATVAMAQRSHLEGRLLAVLDPKRPRRLVTRRKVVLALALMAALLVPLAALHPWAHAEEKSKAAKPDKARPAAKDQVAVSGRVLNPDGKPVAGAKIAVLTYPEKSELIRNEMDLRFEVLGQATADDKGRFHLKVPRSPPRQRPDYPLHSGQMLVTGKGYALGLHSFDLHAPKAEVVVRLKRERILRGRLIDLQGHPVKGVQVRLLAVMEKKEPHPAGVAQPTKKLSSWPQPWTADDQGRFVVRGFAAEQQLTLTVNDDRFAAQVIQMGAGTKDSSDKVTFTLPPAQLIEGRITYEDTGKPVASARVSYQNHTQTTTDKDGRYRLNPLTTSYGHSYGPEMLYALPPEGEPYIGIIQELEKTKAAVKRKMDVALPRGVLVRGRVTEDVSGKPIAGAIVYFFQQNAKRVNPKKSLALGSVFTVSSNADGKFRIAVTSGRGHLVLEGPSPDYVPVVMGQNMLWNNKPGGGRWYAHAFVPLHTKSKSNPKEVAVKLRRGVTVHGRVIGPDGKPATGVQALTRLNVSARMFIKYEPRGMALPDSNFSFGSCDPKVPEPVVFLDEKNQVGALVQLSGKQAGKPLDVKLARCGSALARFVDVSGKPLEGFHPHILLVLTPGPERLDPLSWQKGELAGDSVPLGNFYRQHYGWGKDGPDAKGRVKYPALVPGVTYRIWSFQQGVTLRDFTVKPGETLDLKDIVVKKKK